MSPPQPFDWYVGPGVLAEHFNVFLNLLAVDMKSIMDQQPIDTWEIFPLFHLLNGFLMMNGELPAASPPTSGRSTNHR